MRQHLQNLPAVLTPDLLPRGSDRPVPLGMTTFPGDLPPGAMGRLEQRRILFAHQSVGADLLAGLHDLLAAHPEIHLNLIRQGDGSGYLIDVWVGHNSDPAAKLANFSTLLEGGLGEEVDIALCKLCYADFLPAVDPEAVFTLYRDTLNRLAANYRRIHFAHVTVPLTARQDGWRAVANRLLGRTVAGIEDNLARHRFNELLRLAYGDDVFDLAAIESTWPDGRREIVMHGGMTGYALVPAYTDDGGHLNTLGRRLAAERFLAFLASLS